jgi:hypothetical protein
MPGTFPGSSNVLNLPFSSRYRTIVAASFSEDAKTCCQFLDRRRVDRNPGLRLRLREVLGKIVNPFGQEIRSTDDASYYGRSA